jgi:hypothetical protein
VTPSDPVVSGIVDSLARRLELLREGVPGISRVRVLRDVSASGTDIGFKEYETADVL